MKQLLLIILSAFFLNACGSDTKKEEQLTIDEFQENKVDTLNALKGNATFRQLANTPNSVLLTGINHVRLIPIYKIRPETNRNLQFSEESSYYSNVEEHEEDEFNYFMPGMDIISGYNLINIGHFDIQSEKLSYFFESPVLVRTLYFPGVKADSLMKQPISRNYFMASVYDQDTNKDSIINKRDLRRFYHFDELMTKKTQILPPSYSAIKSTYDYKNDLMYIHARFDANKNGRPERTEPVNIFWIDLKAPAAGKKLL